MFWALKALVLVLIVLGVLGAGEGSNFSIDLVSLDNVVSSVILSFGLDSFCVSGLILFSISCEAVEDT